MLDPRTMTATSQSGVYSWEGTDFAGTAWILGVIYCFTTCLIISRVRTIFQGQGSGLDISKLFILSVLVTSVLRTLSWIGIGLLVAEADDDASSRGDALTDDENTFYNNCVYVMFDLPDFIILSAYALLGLIWGEVALRSRVNYLSSKRTRRPWRIAYLVFNCVLYTIQLLLYTLIFVDTANSSQFLEILFITLSFINYGLPLVFFLFFIYYELKFSGFPYRSPRAKARVNCVSRAMLVWTLSRIAWGVSMLTATLRDFLQARTGNQTFVMVAIVCVFMVSEIWPFFVALDKDLLLVLADDEVCFLLVAVWSSLPFWCWSHSRGESIVARGSSAVIPSSSH